MTQTFDTFTSLGIELTRLYEQLRATHHNLSGLTRRSRKLEMRALRLGYEIKQVEIRMRALAQCSYPVKTCSACQAALPLNRFSVDRRKRDGLQVWCKTCVYRSKLELRAGRRERLIGTTDIPRGLTNSEYGREYYARLTDEKKKQYRERKAVNRRQLS